MQLERLVNDLEEEGQVLVDGVFCRQCECFHYELGPYRIFEWLVDHKERDDASVAGKYITDHDIKKIKKEEEVPV